MEKLSSDVHSAKIDSLLTLVSVYTRLANQISPLQAAGSDAYRKVILEHLEQVWPAIRNEVS